MVAKRKPLTFCWGHFQGSGPRLIQMVEENEARQWEDDRGWARKRQENGDSTNRKLRFNQRMEQKIAYLTNKPLSFNQQKMEI